jgi:hypothetical protein
MIKADRVHSTPPTNTPIDSTRRRFLTVAAGASVASVGSLAAAAMPAAAPDSAACAVDPIYAAIEAHRKAHAAHMASLELLNRFERRYGAGQGSWISTKPCHDENDAFVAFVAEPATTVPGLLAKLDYFEELASEDETESMTRERAEPDVLIQSFAESLKNIGVRNEAPSPI